MSIKISEQFYSIQGEGQTVGVPAVFLRLQGCNLTCGGIHTVKSKKLDSGATWRCDTIEVWTKGKSHSFIDICDEWEDKNWISLFRQGAHLVITGGEPLLQQDAICDLLIYFNKRYDFSPIIEIETNGTIEPSSELIKRVSFFNVSPKLSNSGMQLFKRVVPTVLSLFNSLESTIFKFVISNQDDLTELMNDYITTSFVSHSKVFLMAAASTKEQLNQLEKHIISYCKQYCFRYSNRLHVQIWDQATGV